MLLGLHHRNSKRENLLHICAESSQEEMFLDICEGKVSSRSDVSAALNSRSVRES